MIILKSKTISSEVIEFLQLAYIQQDSGQIL